MYFTDVIVFGVMLFYSKLTVYKITPPQEYTSTRILGSNIHVHTRKINICVNFIYKMYIILYDLIIICIINLYSNLALFTAPIACVYAFPNLL